MDLPKFRSWPVVRQLTGDDPLGRGAAVTSARTGQLAARTETADRVVKSICPYCAVGCGQQVFVQGRAVVQIEGDPDSPVSRGRLCPKGSASEQLVNSPGRQTAVLYRRPHGTEWEPLDLETATDMIADRLLATRQPHLAGHRRAGPAAPAHPRLRQPRRGDAGQRGELPHQEALHRPRGHPDREPGPHLTQLHRPQFGGIVRSGRGNELPAGPAALRLHRHPGLEHGRVPPGRASSGSWRRRPGAPRSSTSTPGSPGPRPSPTRTSRCGPVATSCSSAGS